MNTCGPITVLRRSSSPLWKCVSSLACACLLVAGCTADPSGTALLAGQETLPDRNPPAAAIRVNVFNDSDFAARVQVHLYINDILVHQCEAVLGPVSGSDLADRLLLDVEEADRVVITCRIDDSAGAALWSDQKTYRMGTDFADLDTVAYSIVYPPAGDLPPVADVQAPTVAASGRTVTLDGSYSHDPEGGTLTYSWQQTAGPAVALSNPAGAAPTFTAPDVSVPTDLVFRLTVSDGYRSATRDVTVTIRPNQAPVAVIVAPSSQPSGSTVTLDGSASSDPDGDPLTYSWEQLDATPETTVTLSSTTAAVVTFTAPPAPPVYTMKGIAATGAFGSVQLHFRLTVADGTLSSSAEAFVLVFTPPTNYPPFVYAFAPFVARVNDLVQLDGSYTFDMENDPLTYLWEQVNVAPGTAVTLQGADQPTASFTVPDTVATAESLTFRLTVSDGQNPPVSEIVNVLVGPVAIPLAPPSAAADSLVYLDGTASLGGGALTYQWTQISGPYVFLTNANQAIASFNSPSTGGLMTFELTVDDGVRSHTATVSVQGMSLGAGTAIPIALGPSSAVVGDTVTLYGSASFDAAGGPLTYQWVQTLGPTVALSAPNQPDVTFTVPPTVLVTETLGFRLTVFDSTMTPAFFDVAMLAYPANYAGNRCPFLTVSVDRPTALPGQPITITAIASDPDGDPVNITLGSLFSEVQGTTGPSPLVYTFPAPASGFGLDNVLRIIVEADDGQGNLTIVPVLVTVGGT